MQEGLDDDAPLVDPLAVAALAEGAGEVALTSMSVLDAVLATGRVPQSQESLTAMYGSVELAEGRVEEEQAWMCPRPDQPQTRSVFGGSFVAPERTIVIGTNGVYCFAMQCTSDDSRNDVELRPKSAETAEQDIMDYYTTYKQHNAAVAYKVELLALERSAFMRNQRYHMRTVPNDAAGRKLLTDLQKYATMDVMLRNPLRTLADRYKRYRKHRLETRFEARPAGATKVTRHVDMPFLHDVPDTLAASGATNGGDMWRLLTFDVERMRAWKDINIVMYTEPGTAPNADSGIGNHEVQVLD